MGLLSRKKPGIYGAAEELYGKVKQKKFNYSSEANSLVLERGLADIAELEGCTTSMVIETLIANSVLPDNETASQYYSLVLLGRIYHPFESGSSPYGIREALSEIFREESAWVDFKSRHGDANKPLVEFAKKLIQAKGARIQDRFRGEKCSDRNPMYHLMSCWDSVCNKMEYAAESSGNAGLESFELQQSARFGRAIEHSLKVDSAYPLFNALGYILQNWQQLGDYTYTYRFLGDVFEACETWKDTASDRMEFKDVCNSVMTRWDEMDAAEKELKEQSKIESELISYPMAAGACVKAPSGWVVVNPADAMDSCFAGVIEIKNGAKYNAPHFLFFSSEPIGEMSDNQRAAIEARIIGIWPRFADVKRDEKLSDQIKDAPHVGFFSLYDEGKYPLGTPPYGACIVRTEGGDEGFFEQG